MAKHYTINELFSLKEMKGVEFREKDIPEINKILKKYNNHEIRYQLKTIKGFIKYDVSPKDISWVDRIDIIKTKLFRDSSSLYSHEIRFGEKYGQKLFNDRNNLTTQTLSKYIKKFGEIDGRKKWKDKNKYNGCSLDNFIIRYGDKNGEKKWYEYVNKRSQTYKTNKKNGKKYSNGSTLQDFVRIYGEEEGLFRYNKKYSWYEYRYSKKYYIDKYGKERGIKKWNEYKESMNKTSLKSFIKRYGAEKGNEKYNEYTKKISYINSKDGYIEKYGESIGKKKYQDLILKRNNFNDKYSKISQELFWSIYNHLTDQQKNDCYFAEKNKEYFVRDEEYIIFADFKLNNIIIEFDGEYWHSLNETKKKDIIKNKIYEKKGYKLLRIPEKEYLKNKENVVNKCLKFINN